MSQKLTYDGDDDTFCKILLNSKGNYLCRDRLKCSVFKKILLISFNGKPFSKVFQSKIGILTVNPLSRKNMIKLPNCILIVSHKEKELELKSRNDPIQSPGTILPIFSLSSL